jgi:hypothetical protein
VPARITSPPFELLLVEVFLDRRPRAERYLEQADVVERAVARSRTDRRRICVGDGGPARRRRR